MPSPSLPPFPLFSRSLACTAVMAGASILVLGCGDRMATVPVKGTVLVDGKPASGVHVVFHPVNAADTRFAKVRPSGRTAADGTFELGTYEMADGAPVADYRITAHWFAGGPSGATNPSADPEATSAGVETDRFGGRFANPETSAFKATVGRLTSTIPTIELSLAAPRPPG